MAVYILFNIIYIIRISMEQCRAWGLPGIIPNLDRSLFALRLDELFRRILCAYGILLECNCNPLQWLRPHVAAFMFIAHEHRTRTPERSHGVIIGLLPTPSNVPPTKSLRVILCGSRMAASPRLFFLLAIFLDSPGEPRKERNRIRIHRAIAGFSAIAAYPAI